MTHRLRHNREDQPRNGTSRRPKPDPSTARKVRAAKGPADEQVRVTVAGKTYRVPESKVKAFVGRMEGRHESASRRQLRSLTTNQWDRWPHGE